MQPNSKLRLFPPDKPPARFSKGLRFGLRPTVVAVFTPALTKHSSEDNRVQANWTKLHMCEYTHTRESFHLEENTQSVRQPK